MDKDYIELNTIIKLLNFATSGGEAKMFIRSGKVIVNGIVETRNGKKLRKGDIIEIQGKKYTPDEFIKN